MPCGSIRTETDPEAPGFPGYPDRYSTIFSRSFQCAITSSQNLLFCLLLFMVNPLTRLRLSWQDDGQTAHRASFALAGRRSNRSSGFVCPGGATVKPFTGLRLPWRDDGQTAHRASFVLAGRWSNRSSGFVCLGGTMVKPLTGLRLPWRDDGHLQFFDRITGR